jgi:hypothetical protein
MPILIGFPPTDFHIGGIILITTVILVEHAIRMVYQECLQQATYKI